MKLSAPCLAQDFQAHDTNGNLFKLSDYKGKPIILSFFRDASCPFCNMRVYEFTQKYKEWEKLGIVVVAIFSSPANQIQNFITKHPRPFISIGDPELLIYDKYGIKSSHIGLIKALLFKIPRLVNGIKKGAKTDFKNPNGYIIPADFMISPNGKIVDLWYGRDVADHMPMKRVESFVNRVRLLRQQQLKNRVSDILALKRLQAHHS